MDSVAVFRTIWRQKWFALPAVVLAVAAAVFVYLEGPRTYDSTQSFALANPRVPTEKEIDADPSLLELNSDNPYLRSSDPNLVANVVITRLNSKETADRLEALGLSSDYVVNSGALGGGLVVSISASGDTPRESLSAVTELGTLMDTYLYELQTVNGADERYLFTAIMVAAPSQPTEQLSSRLRTVVVVGIAGLILVFGAISLGTWIDSVRKERAARRRSRESGPAAEEGPEAPEDAEEGTEPPDEGQERKTVPKARVRRSEKRDLAFLDDAQVPQSDARGR
ncbi:chain-length determining protein [Microbacterium caowuchunii]|uniref:Chain-length determining protein n=1 Tax=Microbacterium caowuchunii TaxID=2614638 RepID=A0A5N0TKC4_9MICO|nr:chain-length determining protein [Microbacterium caowuchunii]KAA9135530.1 chain-length determining protein [Microbacterium caowuchunii]